jgi:hypothetical protein
VGIPIEAANGRHLAVIGETGMGKSTLIIALAQRAARLGTVVLMDPLGETARELVASLPRQLGGGLLWVSPKDSPIPSNALAAARGTSRERERAVDEIVDALRRVRAGRFGETPFWGPRVEEAARWAVTVAVASPDGTLADAERLLSEPVGHLPTELPEPAGSALRAIRERRRERPDDIEGGRRLLAEANRSEILRRMLSTPGARWSMSESLRPRGVTVLSGDAPSFGEAAARSYLSVQLALFWCSVVASRRPGPVFLFLDEAPFFAHESLAQMLRLGRRFGLHVVLGAQSLAGFPEPIREAIWTNCSEFVLFRGSPVEAREFDRWGTPVSSERLVNLPRGVAAVLIEKGRAVEWIRTRPRSPPRDSAARLREAADGSAERWGGGSALGMPADRPGKDRSAIPSEARPVLNALQREIGEPGSGDSFRILLDRWRRVQPFSEGAIRAAGRWLSEGAVIRSERTPEGTVWTVDRRKLAGALGRDDGAARPDRGTPGGEDAPAPG